MTSGHTRVLSEAASLNPSALVELFILDASAIGGGILRFHSGTDRHSRPVAFRGESYTPLPVKSEGFSMASAGELPRPSITFANLLGSFTGLSRAYGDLVNARVIRRQVFARNLDGEPEADSREMFQEDIYFIDRKLNENRAEVSYELVPATDIDGAKVPRRQVLSAACVWRYRSPVGCAYNSTVALADRDNNFLPGNQIYRGEWNETTQYYPRDTVFLWQDFERTIKSFYTLSEDSALGENQGPRLNSLWLMDQCSHRLSGCKLRFDPDAVTSSTVKPTAISAGGNFSVALRSDGKLRMWGSNASGQTTQPSGLSSITAVSAGESHCLVLKSNGSVLSWGSNSYGQSTLPTLLPVSAIGAGYNHNLVVQTNGTVVAWGRNDHSQCDVPGGLTGVVAVAGGYLHSLALKSDGTVVAWGHNAFGQSTVPGGLTGVVAISAGDYHCLALKSDGTVVSWGYNSNGQTDVPVGLTEVLAIAAGYRNSLVLKTDGSLVFWGLNDQGQGTLPPSATGSTAIALARGDGSGHALALKASSGVVTSWGRNVEGQTTLPANLVETISVTSATPLPFGGFPGSSRIPR